MNSQDDALAVLMYELLMDKIPAGELDRLVRKAVGNLDIDLPRSPITDLAVNFANKIRNAKVSNFQEKLNPLFDLAPPGQHIVNNSDGPVFSRSTEEITEEFAEEIELMRDEIESAADDLDPNIDFEKLVTNAKLLSKSDNYKASLPKDSEEGTTLDDVDGMLDEFKRRGSMTPEQIQMMKDDLDNLKKEIEDGRTSEEED